MPKVFPRYSTNPYYISKQISITYLSDIGTDTEKWGKALIRCKIVYYKSRKRELKAKLMNESVR